MSKPSWVRMVVMQLEQPIEEKGRQVATLESYLQEVAAENIVQSRRLATLNTLNRFESLMPFAEVARRRWSSGPSLHEPPNDGGLQEEWSDRPSTCFKNQGFAAVSPGIGCQDEPWGEEAQLETVPKTRWWCRPTEMQSFWPSDHFDANHGVLPQNWSNPWGVIRGSWLWSCSLTKIHRWVCFLVTVLGQANPSFGAVVGLLINSPFTRTPKKKSFVSEQKE